GRSSSRAAGRRETRAESIPLPNLPRGFGCAGKARAWSGRFERQSVGQGRHARGLRPFTRVPPARIGNASRGRALAPVAAGGVDDPLAEFLACDHLSEARALDLAAGRLGNRARPHEEDAGGAMAAAVVHALNDLADETAQRLAVVRALTHLR